MNVRQPVTPREAQVVWNSIQDPSAPLARRGLAAGAKSPACAGGGETGA
jgi:hypothetical protein